MIGPYSEEYVKIYDTDVLLADTGEKNVNYKIEQKQTTSKSKKSDKLLEENRQKNIIEILGDIWYIFITEISDKSPFPLDY